MDEKENKSAAINARVAEFIDRIAQLTDERKITEAFQDYFKFCTRFHQYSYYNQIAIMCCNPDATHVAGYKTWLSFNRFVRRGEKGIPILAPCIYKQDPDLETSPMVVKGFRVVYVFDVSQTDGDPLPETPVWTSQDRFAWLEDRLFQLAGDLNISVDRDKLRGGSQGVSRGGSITLAPEAGTCVLVHELAHEILHKKDSIPANRSIKEIEAEGVTAVVMSYFGFDINSAINYLVIWDGDAKTLRSRLDNISKASNQIISYVEKGVQNDAQTTTNYN